MASKEETAAELYSAIKSAASITAKAGIMPGAKAEALKNLAYAYRAVAGGDQPG